MDVIAGRTSVVWSVYGIGDRRDVLCPLNSPSPDLCPAIQGYVPTVSCLYMKKEAPETDVTLAIVGQHLSG